MKYYIISLTATPNQQLTATLDGQICQLHLYWRYGHLYCDVNVQNEIVAQGALCQVNQWIIQQPQINFKGNLLFVDTERHNAQIDINDLGSRFKLCFVPESEM